MSKEKAGGSYGSLNCNFCGKSQKEVKKLIAGPGCYICDECIELCNFYCYFYKYKEAANTMSLLILMMA